MKTVLTILLAFTLMEQSLVFSQAPQTYVLFDPNNISTYLVSSGIFNQDVRTMNTPGFMWPLGSNRFGIYSSGLLTVARVNDSLRIASAVYKGEYSSGCMQNGSPFTSGDFKFYKINRGDGPSNPDWANWYKMIPFGAPYVDINNNGIYDQGIDTPGVKNAKQTIFICMTDGFPATHSGSEGFIGGTRPLKAEMHLTAWAYNQEGLNDAQFIKFEIINKSADNWNSTFFSVFCDMQIGDPSDDFMGCDSTGQFAYGYNSDNMDGTGSPPSYGQNPPAAGIILLQGAVKKNSGINMKMTSFVPLNGSAPCEGFPTGLYPNELLNLMNGLKKDGAHFMNPVMVPRTPSKFCFSGNPESSTGWTEFRGWVNNCGIDSGQISGLTPGSRKFFINTGATDLTVSPGDTQKIVITQMAARGTNNLNSVTKLRRIGEYAQYFYNSNFVFHSVSGTVRYVDNSQPVTSGMVKAVRFNWFTGGIMVLDSAYVQSNGAYLLSHVPQDSVDIGLYPVTTPPRDYVISYYPSTIYWQQASVIFPTENLTNINLGAIRMSVVATGNSVNGRVTGISDSNYVNLKDANLYARNGNTFVQCTSSDFNGRYNLNSLPAGNLKIIVNRIGFNTDSMNVNLSSKSVIDSVNFILNRIYVGITHIGSSVPDKFVMSQNFPNPFNPVTNIKFDLPDNGKVKLVIYNLLGQETAVLVNQNMDAGSYSVAWNASSYPSGVYFYRIYVSDQTGRTADIIQTKKMILIK
ncbi:MAG: T9SS type A sorting domain-containing protein [Ignavibacteria bacterium]|nr:T9SS type A sorting domain-containing protein [Ignavibacteria bacterium]